MTHDSQSISNLDAVLKQAYIDLCIDRRVTVFDIAVELKNDTPQLVGEIYNLELKQQLQRYITSRVSIPYFDAIKVMNQNDEDSLYGVINLSTANIYKRQSHAAEIATQALLGTPVKVLKHDGQWRLIQLPDQYIGWSDEMLVPMSPQALLDWNNKKKVIITDAYAFSFTAPSMASDRIGDLVEGCILAFNGEQGEFYEIEYPDKRIGFIDKSKSCHYKEWTSSLHPTQGSIVATARRFMGIPYFWGGTSIKGVDCSGFVKTVYFQNGIFLPRDADQQARVGIEISLNSFEDFAPGDLLFFGSKAAQPHQLHIVHVGISLGKAQFIHASGNVHISSLDPLASNYIQGWENQLVHARRILNAGNNCGVYQIQEFPYYGRPELDPRTLWNQNKGARA